MGDKGRAAPMAGRSAVVLFVAALVLLGACSSDNQPVVRVEPVPIEDITDADAVETSDDDTAEGEPAAGDEPEPTPSPTPTPTPTQDSDIEPEADVESPEDPTVPPNLPTGPPPTTTPESLPEPPTPQAAPTSEPVPSDELEVEAPPVDAEDPPVISDGTALACAATEEAIEFVDFGDVARVSTALDEAAGHAATATEPDMVAQADVLAGFDGDLDNAFDIIVSTLNVCAGHGYEV